MTSSRREDERVHKNAIFNRLTAGVGSAFNVYSVTVQHGLLYTICTCMCVGM